MEGTSTPQAAVPGFEETKRSAQGLTYTNLSASDRLASLGLGGVLIAYGLSRHTIAGKLLALAGSAIGWWGASGYCPIYKTLEINTADPSPEASESLHLEKAITINRQRKELFRIWRDFENLPSIMDHIHSVVVTGPGKSHWVAGGPAGSTLEWDAEIVAEKQNALISWRSLENSGMLHAGSVRFTTIPNGGGTEVKVTIKYRPPAGVIGATVARLFGKDPEHQIEEGLRRFKKVMEAG